MHVAKPPWLTDHEKPRGVVPGDSGSDVYITAECSENPEKFFHRDTFESSTEEARYFWLCEPPSTTEFGLAQSLGDRVLLTRG
jgi:hypothetical protein